MSDSAPPPFIPAEERASNNVWFGSYLWKLAKTAILTKAAAIAGSVAGDKILGGKGGAFIGYSVAGIGTGLYEGHQHWAPMKGTQRRLEELLPEMAVELNPDTLKEESALQTHIQKELTERQRLFTKLVDRRNPDAPQPRGKATHALAKETATETPGLRRS